MRLERKRLRHVEIQGIDYKCTESWGVYSDIESSERLINIDQRDRLRDIETQVGRGSEVKRH